MTLSEFNPRILNFLYELTKPKSFKSANELSKIISLEGQRRVTSKTIQNWFNYLKKPGQYGSYYVERKLSYFPSIHLNNLGLTSIYVFYEDASKFLIELFPNRLYLGWLYDVQSNKYVLVVAYIVPVERQKEFLSLLTKLKQAGLCSEYNSFQIGPSFRVYSPFHKIVNKMGYFHPERNDISEIIQNIKSLEIFLRREKRIQLSPQIEENPFTIPVIAEYLYELRSSVQVWKAIRTKLGTDVWNYLDSAKNRSDGYGIKRTQLIIKNLGNYDLLNQMRVVYFPFELIRNFCLWTHINTKSRKKLVRIARVFLTNSIYSTVMPINTNEAIFGSILNGEAMMNLLQLLSSLEVKRTFIYDIQKSFDLAFTTIYSVFDYQRIFDPTTCAWKYNQEELTNEIQKLASGAP